jgi:uncharacterized membrane protein YqiK
MRHLQPTWLLVAVLAAVVVGIGLAVWLYGALAAA